MWQQSWRVERVLSRIVNSLFSALLFTTASMVSSLQPITEPAFLISLFILLVFLASMLPLPPADYSEGSEEEEKICCKNQKNRYLSIYKNSWLNKYRSVGCLFFFPLNSGCFSAGKDSSHTIPWWSSPR